MDTLTSHLLWRVLLSSRVLWSHSAYADLMDSANNPERFLECSLHRRHFWHATHDCVAPYIDIILHRGRFWAKSAASGSIRWFCFRSCWTVLSHVMWGWPSCLLQSAGGEANRILLASALSSMCIICWNRVSWRDWIIAVSLGCFVSLRTSSFRTNWYHLMPSSTRRHHWSSASILRASVLDIAQQSKPYSNIGKIHVLYSFNFVEMASRDLQIWQHEWWHFGGWCHKCFRLMSG